MAHRPGYLGTTDHVRGDREPRGASAEDQGPEHPPGSRTAAGGPPNQDPGDRAARKGQETDRRTPRRTRCSTAETADSARTPSQRWQRTGGNRVVAGGRAPRAGTATPRPARPQLPRSSRLLRRRAIKRTRLHTEYNRRPLTCQGVVFNC